MTASLRVWLAACVLVAWGCGRESPRPSPDAVAAPPVRPDAAAPVTTAPAEEDLHEEEREADPRSEAVKIKLAVSPVGRAVVLWGRKKLGEITSARPVLEFARPRGSGPLDLVVQADGFLPHHVRVFTDRDDKLSVRLVRAADAPGLLGYKRPVAAP